MERVLESLQRHVLESSELSQVQTGLEKRTVVTENETQIGAVS